MQIVAGLGGFAAAIVVGTFVEYWGHRIMHQIRWRQHAEHHQHNSAQGWFGEFRAYFLPTIPTIWLGFLYSPEAGVGFAMGDLVYAAMAAFSHQLQHERPWQAFWISEPTHAIHHYHSEWHHNFGITFDLWDRVFGTYKAHPDHPYQRPEGDDTPIWRIHWFERSPPLERRSSTG